jgi:hypothetical protein
LAKKVEKERLAAIARQEAEREEQRQAAEAKETEARRVAKGKQRADAASVPSTSKKARTEDDLVDITTDPKHRDNVQYSHIHERESSVSRYRRFLPSANELPV